MCVQACESLNKHLYKVNLVSIMPVFVKDGWLSKMISYFVIVLIVIDYYSLVENSLKDGWLRKMISYFVIVLIFIDYYSWVENSNNTLFWYRVVNSFLKYLGKDLRIIHHIVLQCAPFLN